MTTETLGMSVVSRTVTVSTVLFISQARGVGGAERVTLSALARVSELNVIVAAPPVVTAFARSLSFETHDLILGRARLVAPLVPGGMAVAKLARRIGAQVLYANQLHAIPHGIAARFFGGPALIAHNQEILSGFPSRLVEMGLSKFASVVIAPSRAAAPRVPDRLLRIVPAGIDLDRFIPVDPAPRVVVGTVGRPSLGKGMHEFIGMARRVSTRIGDVEFLIVGGPAFPHEHAEFDLLKSEAQSIGIEMVGSVQDSAPWYRKMSIFVHSGRPEAFPTTVLEAMASGIPVVAFQWGGLLEMVDHGVTGVLVPGGDETALAEAVLSLLADEKLRARMGETARRVVEERFSLQRSSDRIQEIILAAT